MQQKQGKSKVIAVILAIAAPPVTWLYTYGKDGLKFWIGLLGSMLGFGGVLVGLIGVVFGNSQLVPLLGLLLVNVIVQVWAIIDSVTRTNEWYQEYYS